jgi:hypothetical protein
MVRLELQSYLDKVYPYSKIDTEHTLGGQVHIRFELGEGQQNGTIERVSQSTERALSVFNDTFSRSEHEIYGLIYEPTSQENSNGSRDYLRQQFPADRLKDFYDQVETVNTRYFTKDKSGKEVMQTDEVHIVIGKLPVREIHVRNILSGIAKTEMGFDPGLDQRIFFFDLLTDRAFHMYDDRGCYVWSNKADNIRDIYMKRNDWIVAYHRPEIDEYFRQ